MSGPGARRPLPQHRETPLKLGEGLALLEPWTSPVLIQSPLGLVDMSDFQTVRSPWGPGVQAGEGLQRVCRGPFTRAHP